MECILLCFRRQLNSKCEGSVGALISVRRLVVRQCFYFLDGDVYEIFPGDYDLGSACSPKSCGGFHRVNLWIKSKQKKSD